MDAETAIAKIKEKVEYVGLLRDQARFCPDFQKWHRDTIVLLKRIFGEAAYQVSDFTTIDYVYHGIHALGDARPYEVTYRESLEVASAILTSIAEEIAEYGVENEKASAGNPVNTIERLLSRFHSVVRQIRIRHDRRETIDVRDEYDVQDLLHAILRLHFDDIRTEEWTPSYANTSSRLDFLLKTEKIVIETKMTRRNLSERDIVDQLIVDAARYKEHPDCKTLICFIYDPDGWIGNSAGIISDLEKTNKDVALRVFVYPEMK